MKLPASVQEIANVIGEERALFLVGQLPRCLVAGASGASGSVGRTSGRSVSIERVVMYVPQRLDFGHQLVRILGWEDASKLVQAFPGEILYPANCACVYREYRDQQIARLLAEGLAATVLAEWFGVSDRHVRSVRGEKPQEERRAANDNNQPSTTIPRWRANDRIQTAAA